MSEDKFNLSRRKALAALGTIGVASAGAGLGTSAYFSDQETFENNQLTAGTLDLGVAYSAHYSDWSSDEDGSDTESTDDDVDVNMYDGPAGTTGTASELTPGYTGLPANDAWLIEVDDPDQFLTNTEYDSYNDGEEDLICGADGATSQADGATNPVVSLGDVKPGDFGEVTFDLELCTNPGYVWMNVPDGYTADEGGTTEPELDDPDEADGDGEAPADVVELLDVAQAAVWLDDGDNYQDGGESPLLAGNLRTVLDALDSGNGVRIDGQNVELAAADPTAFTTTDVTRFDTDGDGNYDVDVELVEDPAPGESGSVAHATSGGANTPDYVASGVSVGATMGDFGSGASLTYEYYEGPQNARAAPDEVYLLLRKSDGTEHVVYRTSNDERPNGNLGSPPRPPGNWYTRNVGDEIRGDFAYNAGFNWNDLTTGDNYDALNTNFAGDTEIVSMAFGKGGLGGTVSDVYYRNPQLDGSSLGSFPTACFRGETDFSAAFAWWVPVDHGNEIQSDSVEFDLGFYTEQCRHNDGSGMNNDAVSDDQTDDS
jgi:predicted ribosomally synthesized peptide with SipW-like signal peptide